MILRGLIIACAALVSLCGFLWWRLDAAQEKADRLDTCEEVRDLNREIGNETDDDLLRGISEPDGL